MSRYTRNFGSRLGKFERQRFGGSGAKEPRRFGAALAYYPGVDTSFLYDDIDDPITGISIDPDQFPEEAAAQERRTSITSAKRFICRRYRYKHF